MTTRKPPRPPEPIQFTWAELQDIYVMLVMRKVGSKRSILEKVGAVLDMRDMPEEKGVNSWAKLKKELGL